MRKSERGSLQVVGFGPREPYRAAPWPTRLIAFALTSTSILAIVGVAIYDWRQPTRTHPRDKVIVVTLLPNSAADRPVTPSSSDMPAAPPILTANTEELAPAAELGPLPALPVPEPLAEQTVALGSDRQDPDVAVSHSYQRAILGRINAQRRYPRSALIEGLEGKGAIRFTIERGGRLIDASISASTGRRELDRATLDLVRRAAPFPPIPVELPDQLEVTMPIRFLILSPAEER